MTASRVEAVFEVGSSELLSEAQKRRVMAKCGPRVVAVAQDTRSQARNREIAVRRLVERVKSALVVPRARKRTKPGRGAVERRLEAKRRRSERKRDRRRPEAP